MGWKANDIWMCKVREALREGYGVEDIALKLECHVEHVRTEVKILRDMGVLNNLFSKP